MIVAVSSAAATAPGRIALSRFTLVLIATVLLRRMSFVTSTSVSSVSVSFPVRRVSGDIPAIARLYAARFISSVVCDRSSASRALISSCVMRPFSRPLSRCIIAL